MPKIYRWFFQLNCFSNFITYFPNFIQMGWSNLYVTNKTYKTRQVDKFTFSSEWIINLRFLKLYSENTYTKTFVWYLLYLVNQIFYLFSKSNISNVGQILFIYIQPLKIFQKKKIVNVLICFLSVFNISWPCSLSY